VSCSVHDMVEVEGRGVPTVTICTEGFLNAGVEKAAMAGVLELRIVSIPAPFASLSPAEARQRGLETLEIVAAALMGTDRR
jgi:hypothetical protein